jgi:hypothetical protein
MRPIFATSLLLLSGVSCSDNAAPDAADLCQTVALPLTGDPAGPTVTDVALDPQVGEGVVVLATATDPAGTDNMLNVFQTIGVFADPLCRDATIMVQDDLACSGCEESFGIAVGATHALFDEIAAAETWPVTLDFTDVDGHRTLGRVLARIVR